MLKIQQIGISKKFYQLCVKYFLSLHPGELAIKKVSLATKEDYPLLFCATHWVKSQLVTAKAQSIWPKIVAVENFWSTLPK